MIPSSFKYHRAHSIEDALSLISEDVKILAGGHSLIPALKLRLNQPEKLVDISQLAELKFIRQEGNTLIIGARSTHNDIATSELVEVSIPVLCEGANTIGDVQVRNMGTLGGSIAHADPAADWPALLLLSEAQVKVVGKSGEKMIRASDFFTGFFETALDDNELITEIHFPIPDSSVRSVYMKYPQPASRFAVVGCAASIGLDEGRINNARLAYNGVSEFAYRDKTAESMMEGADFTEGLIDNVSQVVGEGVTLMEDAFASGEYRKHLAKVYTKRALSALL